jgi:hypothetical protein
MIASGEMKTLWNKWFMQSISRHYARLNMGPPDMEALHHFTGIVKTSRDRGFDPRIPWKNATGHATTISQSV